MAYCMKWTKCDAGAVYQTRVKLCYVEKLALCLYLYDNHRDMITQSLLRQIKDPKHPLHYLLPPVKVSHSQIVLQPIVYIHRFRFIDV